MLIDRIKRQLNNGFLTKNEEKVARTILKEYGADFQVTSIYTLSKRAQVSKSAITRFFYKIGENGFKGFQMTLFHESKNYESEFVKPSIRSFIETKNCLKENVISLLAKQIVEQKHTTIYASGFSRTIAKNFERQLNKINIRTTLIGSSDIVKIFPNDSVHLFISISGKSSDLMNAMYKLNTFGENNLKIYSITSTRHSNVKKYSLEHIHGIVYDYGPIKEYKELPTIHSQIMHLILDVIFSKIYSISIKKNDNFLEKLIKI